MPSSQFDRPAMSAKTTNAVLENVFHWMWKFCAGWNRVAFGCRQVRHIMNTYRVNILVAPLGRLDAMLTIIDGEKFIVLNCKLCPQFAERDELYPDDYDQLSNRARFALFHELGHACLHGDVEDFWRRGIIKAVGPIKWIESSNITDAKGDVLDKEAAGESSVTLREIEADYFALIALLPDRVLYERARDKGERLSIDDVKQLLRDPPERSYEVWSEDTLSELAQYRLHLFDTFALAYWEVSARSYLNPSNGKPFACTPVFPLRSTAKQLKNLVAGSKPCAIAEIIRFHPRLVPCDEIPDSIEQSDLFSFLRVHSERDEWGGQLKYFLGDALTQTLSE